MGFAEDLAQAKEFFEDAANTAGSIYDTAKAIGEKVTGGGSTPTGYPSGPYSGWPVEYRAKWRWEVETLPGIVQGSQAVRLALQAGDFDRTLTAMNDLDRVMLAVEKILKYGDKAFREALEKCCGTQIKAARASIDQLALQVGAAAAKLGGSAAVKMATWEAERDAVRKAEGLDPAPTTPGLQTEALKIKASGVGGEGGGGGGGGLLVALLLLGVLAWAASSR